MSQDNVTVAKNAYAAFQRGDMDALLGAMTADVDWTLAGRREDFPTLGDWKGKAAVRDFFATVADTMEFSDFSPREFCACDDKVFVLGHYAATIRRTGRPAASDWVHVFTVRGGKVTRFRELTDTASFAAAWKS